MTQRSILLHVGSPKCGSTYLQQVLLRNADVLLDHGFAYPHTNTGHPGNAADLADITAERLDSLFDFGARTVILSHEDLYGLPKRGDALAKLAPEMGINVQLVAFLRPFSEFIFGDYSQFMKQHFKRYLTSRNPYDGRDFAAFTQRRVENLKPSQFLRNWQKRFPDTSLRLAGHRDIRPIIEALLPGLPTLDWEVPRALTNPSLRMEDCDRIAAAMRDPSIKDAEIRHMMRDAFHDADEYDLGKTQERIDYVESQFEEQNKMLLEEFSYDNRLKPRA